jgi:hypothetical protein
MLAHLRRRAQWLASFVAGARPHTVKIRPANSPVSLSAREVDGSKWWVPAFVECQPLAFDDHLVDGRLIKPEGTDCHARYRALGVEHLPGREVREAGVRVAEGKADDGLANMLTRRRCAVNPAAHVGDERGDFLEARLGWIQFADCYVAHGPDHEVLIAVPTFWLAAARWACRAR